MCLCRRGTKPAQQQSPLAPQRALQVRGPYATFGYGWTGCADATHPFTRPADLDVDYGVPIGFCAETGPGSGVFTREWTKATVTLDCNSFNATIAMK